MTKRLDPGLTAPSSSSSIGGFLESPAGALLNHCQHGNSLNTSLSEWSKLTYHRHGLEKGYGPGRRVNLHGEMRYGRDHSDGRLGSRQLVRQSLKKACGKAGQHNLPS